MTGNEFMVAFSEVALEYKWKERNAIIKAKKESKSDMQGYIVGLKSKIYKQRKWGKRIGER